PPRDQHPNGQQQAVNQDAASGQFHNKLQFKSVAAYCFFFLPGGSLVGNTSKYRFSSSSVSDLEAFSFSCSASEMDATSVGEAIMCGVRKINSSVLAPLLVFRLKRFPIQGMSPRSGILLSASAF